MGEIRLDLLSSTLSYWLGSEFRGHGYMTEAVRCLAPHAREELRMRSLIADVARENLASRQVLETSGFRFQFIHRRADEPSLKHIMLLRYKLALSL